MTMSRAMERAGRGEGALTAKTWRVANLVFTHAFSRLAGSLGRAALCPAGEPAGTGAAWWRAVGAAGAVAAWLRWLRAELLVRQRAEAVACGWCVAAASAVLLLEYVIGSLIINLK